MCQERVLRKPTKKIVQKEKLDALNHQWGIDPARASDSREGDSVEGGRSGRKVSFQSPVEVCNSPAGPQPDVLHEDSRSMTPTRRATRGRNQWPRRQLLGADSSPGSQTAGKEHSDPSCQIPKRGRPRTAERAQGTPKKPRPSPGPGAQFGEEGPAHVTPVASPAANASCRKLGEQQRESSASPPFLKRNHKGETPLHLAAIKVGSVNCLFMPLGVSCVRWSPDNFQALASTVVTECSSCVAYRYSITVFQLGFEMFLEAIWT